MRKRCQLINVDVDVDAVFQKNSGREVIIVTSSFFQNVFFPHENETPVFFKFLRFEERVRKALFSD